MWFERKLIRQDNKWVMTDRLASVRANGNGERFNYYPHGQEMTPTGNSQTKFPTYWRIRREWIMHSNNTTQTSQGDS